MVRTVKGAAVCPACFCRPLGIEPASRCRALNSPVVDGKRVVQFPGLASSTFDTLRGCVTALAAGVLFRV